VDVRFPGRPRSASTRIRPDVEKARSRLSELISNEVRIDCEGRTHRIRVTTDLTLDLLDHPPLGSEEKDDSRLLAAIDRRRCACDEARRAWTDRDFDRLPPRLRTILEQSDLLTLLEAMAGPDATDRS
jgi:hypothetical protein